jgi:hypothetical protein
MLLYKKIRMLLFCLMISVGSLAQFGVQIGTTGSCIFNPNPNTLVFPFSPILNYELATAYRAQINEKLSYKVELGYANKGALQSGGTVTNSFVKSAFGYLYGLFGAQYEFANGWNFQLALAPSYMVLYKKYDKGNVQNFISIIDRRYKVDAPISLGVSKMVGKLNEFTLRYGQSFAPFAVQRNVFPTPSIDRFYHIHLSLIYTFYLASAAHTSND